MSGSPVNIVSVIKRSEGSHIFSLNIDQLKYLLTRNDEIKNRFIVVVSIAGAMRRGKSFMLNFFLRYLRAQYVSHDLSNWMGYTSTPLSGFDWRNGMRRVTSGILVWSELFLYNAPNGDKMAIMLMDTQGVFDNESTVSENTTIFAISTMISSLQIFNIQGNLQEDDLQHLQMFSGYGKIALGTTGVAAFQNLLILIRDWQSPHDAPFGAVGGRIVLDRVLNPLNQRNSELRTIREDIRSSFETIDCYLMMHPGLTMVEATNFDGNLTMLRPEFVQQLLDFVPYVLGPGKLVPKTINGQKLKACDLVLYFEEYVKFFNSGLAPLPERLYESTSRANHLAALDAGFQFYCERIITYGSSVDSIEQLKCLQQDFENQAIVKFSSAIKIRNHNFLIQYQKELVDKMRIFFVPFLKAAEERQVSKSRGNHIAALNTAFQYYCEMITAKGLTVKYLPELEELHDDLKQQTVAKFASEIRIANQIFFDQYEKELFNRIRDHFAVFRQETEKRLAPGFFMRLLDNFDPTNYPTL